MSSMTGDAWGWNWWEVVSYWRSGTPCWTWMQQPRRDVLPFILPIMTTPPTLAMDRVICQEHTKRQQEAGEHG
jgi:hypothetical protein